ncbi:hypothetical protein MXMO3_01371 [Maritalea myrionectae]|uniref:Uncharacterized protein n=1 Tax=Maritalea myrionectae TaxID=454601 RepID=A0A2R4MCY0_9HYPH|nr:hypothetical protein [Maritalea myrionectae]AVX03901.1 hypothetical protein MXMO3_01371 [Maritalea myrionectae]
MRTKMFLITMVWIGSAVFAYAQTNHTGHSDDVDHSTHGQSSAMNEAILREPGQGAFAALSEVVRVLEADPETDWSKVDLTGLRMHLVDMDRLISDGVVEETNLPNGISAFVTGDAETIATLRRMVPAHAVQLASDDRWTVAASETEDGVELRVTSDNPSVIARIKGLGFFGLMASQDHHREHHLMMARGEEAHGH